MEAGPGVEAHLGVHPPQGSGPDKGPHQGVSPPLGRMRGLPILPPCPGQEGLVSLSASESL